MKTFWDDYLKHNIPFFIFSGIAIMLLIVAFILPPTAIIDRSILAAVGEIMGFAALWTVIIAIEKGTSASLRKGDLELEIKESKNKKEEIE